MKVNEQQATDGIGYVPQEIQGLLNAYGENPDDLSSRQAIFSKLYQGGGDAQKLAMNLAANDKADGYDGLRSQLIAAYTPQEQELGDASTRGGSKRRNATPTINLAAVQNTGSAVPQQDTAGVQAGGVYQNLPQNSALLFLRDQK
ncbi:hypothetical protein ACTQV0_02860 [Selenomonas montiformis]|uniref:hypothetical protein n=1 Tax=Selenomonas montiformis TaxID=2652285 RepID=UPI003F8B4A7A